MVTSRRLPILTFMEDTGPGVHDSVAASCSHTLYEILLGIKPEVRLELLCCCRIDST